MPGSHTFCISSLQAIFSVAVPILYKASFLVNSCCNCAYISGHGFETRIQYFKPGEKFPADGSVLTGMNSALVGVLCICGDRVIFSVAGT